jgi:hypothetical protein
MSDSPPDRAYSKDHQWAKISGRLEAMTRIGDLVSFEPDEVEITIDGRKLEPVPGQTVVEHGPDRNLSVDEIGGIRLTENESPTRVRT